MERGLFISFEGADGSGKTTQLRLAAQALRDEGFSVVETREPGGTELAEKVRALVLDAGAPLEVNSEVLLYLAARCEHTARVIRPAVRAGKIVLCDRFCDSTFVYQGFAYGADARRLEELRSLNLFATGGVQPDKTLLLDGSPEELLQRRASRGVSDRYENRGLDFQQRVRDGFLSLAHAEPERFSVVDACREQEAVLEEVLRIIRTAWRQVR